ncbi:hypothetical protein [Acidisphaera sp. L21]|jgi:hypothetical protein|uniref:hypothetical protein n=1 Tax=Acidisphaera sp. L21 TaxID=1641851 RepID=UPI00131EAE07|nr:hypothetical protein [Acidisphaera sp. L21]
MWKELKRFLAQYQPQIIPTKPVNPAHEVHIESTDLVGKVVLTSRLDASSEQRFLLCVCTIEARKNHIYLFYIWQRMISARDAMLVAGMACR